MTPDEMKARSRGVSVDMSPEAIAHRINIVSELRAAMIELEKARRVDPPRPKSDEAAGRGADTGPTARPGP